MGRHPAQHHRPVAGGRSGQAPAGRRADDGGGVRPGPHHRYRLDRRRHPPHRPHPRRSRPPGVQRGRLERTHPSRDRGALARPAGPVVRGHASPDARWRDQAALPRPDRWSHRARGRRVPGSHRAGSHARGRGRRPAAGPRSRWRQRAHRQPHGPLGGRGRRGADAGPHRPAPGRRRDDAVADRMRPWAAPLAGRVEEVVIESSALAGNPLGDPAQRPLLVYLPPGYDDSDATYPSVYVLQGFTGQVDMWRNRSAFRPTMLEAVDAVFTEGAPPCIVVFVDAWTSLGGSQFLDSPATGNYHTYLCDDVVAYVDSHYRTHGDRDHRAVMGKSSGGYGAMVSAMMRPDVWAAFATTAGDCAFELCYQPEFPQCARALTRDYGGSYERFWEDFRSRVPFAKSSDHTLLNQWAMAACYSADADGTVRLPFDIETGLLVPDVWERWLAKDPVRMVAHCADGLRSMRTIWVDAGKSDEFFLDVGAVAFRKQLEAIGVDCRFELFDGRHGGTDWRYPLSLSHLASKMSA